MWILRLVVSLTSIDSVEFFVTDTEVEALILENTLIKKHQPKYNINLKDAKTYAFIQLTDEEFPRLLIARQKQRERKISMARLSQRWNETMCYSFSIERLHCEPVKKCRKNPVSVIIYISVMHPALV